MRVAFVFLCVPAFACARQDDRPIVPPPSVAVSASSTPAIDSLPVAAKDSAHSPALPDTTPRKWPTEAELLKWVHRLPPDSFPGLPKTVRAALDRRHCQIPQAAGSPTNAISGAFTAKGTVEWAVLCSVHDTSQMLVISAGTGAVVDSTERTADSAWIQSYVGSTWVFSESIDIVPMSVLNTPPSTPTEDVEPGVDYAAFLPFPIDHDGINVVFLDKAGSTLYSSHGKWYRVSTSD
jgi:hypothetical protein